MKVGIIGCGNIAKAHIAALTHIDEVSSFVLYDLDEEKMNSIASVCTLPVAKVNSLAQLAQLADCFVVCTPNSTHKNVILEVLRVRKIPFVCEKPLSSTLKDALLIAEQAPLGSMISFNYRYNYIFQNIKKYIREHQLGECLFFSAEFNKNSAIIREEFTWRDSGEEVSSSGALGDLSCHLLDMLCWIADDEFDINSIRTAKGTRVKEKKGHEVAVDDNGYILGTTHKGVLCKIKTSKSELDEESLGLYLHLICENAEIMYSTKNSRRIFVKYFNSFENELLEINQGSCLSDPQREIPFWSDSFLHMHSKWIRGIVESQYDALPNMQNALHIQEVLSLIAD
ncbi:Gfo/Idh/MocA family oxidoreductase [Elizabethkingia argentiflava]|uniref:Gfo/Idh/MocA family oxidoreductase n=1 Tax=Elizabethkingia argenteiflava TaxID=2681556 RepID=A0A845PW95_9FLAO|nr:Gfo/Idh/MocA family oxidoreductase [Elizabethkingia argenteiflava]NAW52114.1 Gfo/Idh/MocA family oxidoreductase [Elizabethkingia argenteiflava]